MAAIHNSLKPLLRSVSRRRSRLLSLSYKIRTKETVTEPTEGPPVERSPDQTFDNLLASSGFFANCQGETPVGQKVKAKIIAERGDNLYIDFGGKFHAVVDRPSKNGQLYRKGKYVNVIVEDIEVTEHFLGASKDTSLLEAQVKLVGLH